MTGAKHLNHPQTSGSVKFSMSQEETGPADDTLRGFEAPNDVGRLDFMILLVLKLEVTSELIDSVAVLHFGREK